MKELKQEELFPYFAYKYSTQLDPEKYGSVSSLEEWKELIQSSPEDMEKITAAAAALSEEEWQSLGQEYAELNKNAEMQMAAKGAKLKKLQSMKKKKCSCGCDMAIKKSAKGGFIEMCSCGCGGK